MALLKQVGSLYQESQMILNLLRTLMILFQILKRHLIVRQTYDFDNSKCQSCDVITGSP